MTRTIARKALYERVWASPMVRLATELELSPGRLKTICERAAVPTPPSGWWTKVELGKAPAPPELGPAPDGVHESILLEPTPIRITAAASPAPKPGPARLVAATPQPPVAEGAAPPAAKEPPPRPTKPTNLARAALYEEVWTTPLSRLGPRYGVTGNGLAKICDRHAVPYPPRGWWTKHAMGKPAPRTPLPPISAGQRDEIVIRPSPASAAVAAPSPAVQVAFAELEAKGALTVPERLARPHPVVARWIAEHEAKRRESASRRDPWLRGLGPKPFDEADRRRHRFWSALFKALEGAGGRVPLESTRGIHVEVEGEEIELALREKSKQVRRPLTKEQRAEPWNAHRETTQELQPTGRLLFEIRSDLPNGMRRQWLEAEDRPIEDMLPSILAGLLAAGPALKAQRLEREAQRLAWEEEARLRREAQDRKQREANQWLKLAELARRSDDAARVRTLLDRVAARGPHGGEIEGRSVEAWLAWARDLADRADPAAWEPSEVFEELARVTSWSTPERR